MRRFVPTAFLAFMAIAPATAAMAASPSLTMTDPAANAVVKAPVYMVHLMFDQPIDINSVVFTVTDRNGRAVDVQPPMQMDPENKMLMAIPNKPLPPGKYDVRWRATSPDGMPVSGEFSFTAQ